MIAAISMMRRRPDITLAQFRKHWLDPHGVMTAELPGVRYYIQSHCIDAPATNALARKLDMHGFPELWFDDYAGRKTAYTSKRIVECNVDSENFVGAVTRLVTEPRVIIAPPSTAKPVKVVLLALGAPDPGWADRAQARITGLPGIAGYVHQKVLEQAAAPDSRIPELKIEVGGFAEAIFASEAALAAASGQLAGDGTDAAKTAIYRVEDYRLV